MRLNLSIAVLAVLLAAGCARNTNAPLPAGATSPSDASSYRVLNDAHAFLQSIRDSVAAGKLTLTAAQKAIFNDLVTASNAADATWELCHAGGCTTQQQTQLATQTNDLNGKLATAQSQIVTAP